MALDTMTRRLEDDEPRIDAASNERGILDAGCERAASEKTRSRHRRGQ